MADIRLMTTAAPNNTALIIIGDEILTGRTQDVNIQFLAAELASLGLPLAEIRVVPDVQAEIVEAVNILRAKFKYVFTTGGIGPTHDDITAESVAHAFAVPLLEDAEAVRRLQDYYGHEPGKLNAARLRMANVPQGATLIDNPVSAAPGFCIGNVFVMAGVPKIMQAMFAGVKPLLHGGPPLLSKTIRSHMFEGDLAAGLTAVAARHADVTIGSYPTMANGKPLISLVVRGYELSKVSLVRDELSQMLIALGDTPEELP